MKKIFCLTIFSLCSWACFAQESLNSKDFQTKLSSTPNAVLLDVRTPEEVAQGKIPGAVNIDFNNPKFDKKISELDKSKPYFVYCAKGGRSSKAVDKMQAMGFKLVYNLEGGFNEWSEKGMPVSKE